MTMDREKEENGNRRDTREKKMRISKTSGRRVRKKRKKMDIKKEKR